MAAAVRQLRVTCSSGAVLATRWTCSACLLVCYRALALREVRRTTARQPGQTVGFYAIKESQIDS